VGDAPRCGDGRGAGPPATDLITGVAWHSGDPLVVEHFANAYVRMKAGHRLVRKEHAQSDRKIDSVVGAALAYEARADARRRLGAGASGVQDLHAAYGFN
jgi:hypothetical protein